MHAGARARDRKKRSGPLRMPRADVTERIDDLLARQNAVSTVTSSSSNVSSLLMGTLWGREVLWLLCHALLLSLPAQAGQSSNHRVRLRLLDAPLARGMTKPDVAALLTGFRAREKQAALTAHPRSSVWSARR